MTQECPLRQCSPASGGNQVHNPMSYRNYPCDSIVVEYFGGKSSDLDAVGEKAFKKQLWQCMMGQALEIKSNIETRRAGNTFGITVWQYNEIWPETTPNPLSTSFFPRVNSRDACSPSIREGRSNPAVTVHSRSHSAIQFMLTCPIDADVITFFTLSGQQVGGAPSNTAALVAQAKSLEGDGNRCSTCIRLQS